MNCLVNGPKICSLVIVVLLAVVLSAPAFGDKAVDNEELARQAYVSGEQSYKSGDLVSAAVMWDLALQHKPGSAYTADCLKKVKLKFSGKDRRAYDYCAKGLEYQKKGQYSDAEKAFRQASICKPNAVCAKRLLDLIPPKPTVAAAPLIKIIPYMLTNPVSMEMISIPSGAFVMGTPDSYTAIHNEDEHPQHPVSLSPYSIGKYEVTRGQYKQFMNAGGYTNPAFWSADGWKWQLNSKRKEPFQWEAKQDWSGGAGYQSQPFVQTDNYPVLGLCYYEAEAFCKWAGGHLPTEAQWERAAGWTGTRANIYPWGDIFDAEKCNNSQDHNPAGGGFVLFQTAAVGSYQSGASPCGCQDMAGNVSEYCKDSYGKTYYANSPPNDPQGPESDGSCVLRGSSWDSYRHFYRCAYRGSLSKELGIYFCGFRLAR